MVATSITYEDINAFFDHEEARLRHLHERFPEFIGNEKYKDQKDELRHMKERMMDHFFGSGSLSIYDK